MKRTRQGLIFSLAALLLITSSFTPRPAAAQAQAPSQSEAAVSQQTIQLSIQANHSTAIVNGAPIHIAKPFFRNGTTMVPVDLVTSAFGMDLQWKDPDYSFTLTVGGRSIHMTIDDTRAAINRNMQWIAEAPEYQQDQLMVPLRPIIDTLQGSITYAKGGKITASWDSRNQYADFSRIGSKEQGWSIDLPDDWVYYQDSEYTTMLINPDLSAYVKLLYQGKDYPYYDDSMIFDYDDRQLMYKLLSKSYVEEDPHGVVGTIDGTHYAQLEYYGNSEEETDIEDISNESYNSESVSEIVYADLDRVYQSKTHFYTLSTTGMSKAGAEQLLDSFRPYYSTAPLGALIEQPRQITESLAVMEPYGVSIMLPVTWFISPGTSYYQSTASRWDNKQFIRANIHEASASLTATDMMKQYLNTLKQFYQPEAYELMTQRTVRLKSGQLGVLQQMVMHDPEHPRLYTLYVLHVVDGPYGYHIELADYNSDSGTSADNESLLELITIDNSLVTETHGELDYMLEGQGTHQVVFDEINVSIQAPKSWNSDCLILPNVSESCWLALPFGDSMSIYKVTLPFPLEKAAEVETAPTIPYSSIKKVINDQYQVINGYQARVMDIAHSIKLGDKEELEYVSHVAYIQHGDDLYYVSIFVEPDFSSYVKEQFLQALATFEILP